MILDGYEIKHLLISEEQCASHRGDGICISVSKETGALDFDPKRQIGNDSIDLRISNKAYVMNDDYKYINTLSEEKFNCFFDEKHLSIENGYDLKPGEILFINTVERIHLIGNISGRVTGRSSFARMGLAVHCTQDKFSSGINSVVCLQLINHSNNVLKIFPYQKLAQIIIQKTGTINSPYTDGNYTNEAKFTLPVVSDKDREQYSETERMLIKQNIPKKKNLIMRHMPRKELHALFQSIINVIISLFITMLSFLDPTKIVIATCIMLDTILIIMNIYFYKDAKIDE